MVRVAAHANRATYARLQASSSELPGLFLTHLPYDKHAVMVWAKNHGGDMASNV